MPRGDSGQLVSYTDKEGKTCYGIAYNAKQDKAFGNRLVINRITYPDFQPVQSEGKNLVTLKDISLLKFIGMVD